MGEQEVHLCTRVRSSWERRARVNGKIIETLAWKCGCGAHVTYEALEIGHVDDGCNAKGGVA